MTNLLTIIQVHPETLGFTFPTTLLPHRGPKAFKVYPGVRYAPEIAQGLWVAPVEAKDWLIAVGETLGLRVKDKTLDLPSPDEEVLKKAEKNLNPKLYPYQRESTLYSLEDRSHMVSYEMGLGKTVTALEAIRLTDPRWVLIVCPAVARDSTWPDEIAKWWVDCPLEVKIASGKAYTPVEGITITSYQSLGDSLIRTTFDAVVLDESHYVSNPRAQRSKAIRVLRDHNPSPETLWIQLTGTPMANAPKDLWNQLDVLFPGRYGTRKKFCDRYCIKKANQYRPRGFDYGGLTQEKAEELESRLTWVSTRVTKRDVKDLLPPYTTNRLRIPLEDLTVPTFTERAYNAWLKDTGDSRIDPVVDWVKNTLECGVSHLVVFVHLKKTGRALASRIQHSTFISGELSPKDRIAAIEDGKRAQKSVLVCTMASVGISINNLAFYRTGIVAELAYYPVEVLQAIARLYRLSSEGPVSITFAVSDSGPDSRIAWALEEKIKDSEKVFSRGASEDSVLAACEDKDWQKRILEGIKLDFGDSDEYGDL